MLNQQTYHVDLFDAFCTGFLGVTRDKQFGNKWSAWIPGACTSSNENHKKLKLELKPGPGVKTQVPGMYGSAIEAARGRRDFIKKHLTRERNAADESAGDEDRKDASVTPLPGDDELERSDKGCSGQPC